MEKRSPAMACSSVADAIEHAAQALDLRRQVERMVADEEAQVMREIGIGQLVDCRVVIVPDHLVARETAPGDDAIADIGVLERLKHAPPLETPLRVEHDREAEGRALAVLALDDEALVAGEERRELRPVLAPRRRHGGELLELLAADC